jgi:hypothetical protein
MCRHNKAKPERINYFFTIKNQKIMRQKIMTAALAIAALGAASEAQARKVTVYGGGGAYESADGSTQYCPNKVEGVCATFESRVGTFNPGTPVTVELADGNVFPATIAAMEGDFDADGNIQGSDISFYVGGSTAPLTG